MGSKNSKNGQQTNSAAAVATPSPSAAPTAEAAKPAKTPKMSTRAKFAMPNGATLDVLLREKSKGFETLILWKRVPKPGEEKVPTERGKRTDHATQAEAQAAFDQLVAATKAKGWIAKQMVQKSSFTEIPEPTA